MSISKMGRFTKVAAAVAAAVSMIGVATASVSAEPKAVIGGKAPDFTLTDLKGNSHTLTKLMEKEDKIVVLEWYNPGCPFVKKHYDGKAGNKTMIDLAERFKDDVVWLRINSGAPGKQGAGLDLNTKIAKDWGISRPILLDEDGKVGKIYGAKRTPEMFIISREGTIEYHGAIDDTPRGRKADAVNYVEMALKQVIAGETVTTRSTDAYGCSVKYAN